MFAKLANHHPGEYDGVAPFKMPSAQSVMQQFSHDASTYESKAPVAFL
jgi:hypothetical protein